MGQRLLSNGFTILAGGWGKVTVQMNSKSLLVDAKSLLLWAVQASPEEEQLYMFICIESQRSGYRHGHLRSEEQLTGCVDVGLEGGCHCGLLQPRLSSEEQ